MYATKLRAFQLDTDGSSFSFYKNNHYTLIEARIPKGGIGVLQHDLKIHYKTTIDALHITSWDTDHCNFDDLVQILNHFRPELIEVPDYEPESDLGKLSKDTLMKYDHIHQKNIHNVKVISKKYIQSLQTALPKETNNIVMESMYESTCKNDMSLIKLFRSAGFNVLSLGDCESSETAERLMKYALVNSEVDVLILPHHGANNGFISPEFLKKVNPKLAICSANHSNQYDHPKQEVRQMLFDAGIKLYTTKTGDVIITHTEGEEISKAINLMADNNSISSNFSFRPKKF